MTISRITRPLAVLALGLAGAVTSAQAQTPFRNEIGNDMSRCSGRGPAVRVDVSGIKSGEGNMRVQLYRGIKSDWLESGRWISRIEVPAREGGMAFCLPVPETGTYAIAVRHDVNGNGKTDLRTDGGGMSNNPSINLLNLGKPSYRKTAFDVGAEIKPISIRMRYM